MRKARIPWALFPQGPKLRSTLQLNLRWLSADFSQGRAGVTGKGDNINRLCVSHINNNKWQPWRSGCGFRGDVGSCRMWVTPRDLSSGLPLTLLVSCGKKIGPIFLAVCAGCSLESLQGWCIFSGSLHGLEEPLRRVVSHAACELPVPAPPCLWSCPSSHHSSRAGWHISQGHFFLNRTSPGRWKCGQQGRVSLHWHESRCRETSQYSLFHVTVSKAYFAFFAAVVMSPYQVQLLCYYMVC